jgi:hypothetical protein
MENQGRRKLEARTPPFALKLLKGDQSPKPKERKIEVVLLRDSTKI